MSTPGLSIDNIPLDSSTGSIDLLIFNPILETDKPEAGLEKQGDPDWLPDDDGGTYKTDEQVAEPLPPQEEEHEEIKESTRKKKKRKSEKVVMRKWYLILMPKDKLPVNIRLEGKRSDNTVKEYWRTSYIVDRLSATELVTVSGTVYEIEGELNSDQCKAQGWSQEILEKFRHGFPENWKELVHNEVASRKEYKDSLKKSSKKSKGYSATDSAVQSDESVSQLSQSQRDNTQQRADITVDFGTPESSIDSESKADGETMSKTKSPKPRRKRARRKSAWNKTRSGKKKISKSQSTTDDKAQKEMSGADTSVEHSQAVPKTGPESQKPCGHRCKDKVNCLHSCCKPSLHSISDQNEQKATLEETKEVQHVIPDSQHQENQSITDTILNTTSTTDTTDSTNTTPTDTTVTNTSVTTTTSTTPSKKRRRAASTDLAAKKRRISVDTPKTEPRYASRVRIKTLQFWNNEMVIPSTSPNGFTIKKLTPVKLLKQELSNTEKEEEDQEDLQKENEAEEHSEMTRKKRKLNDDEAEENSPTSPKAKKRKTHHKTNKKKTKQHMKKYKSTKKPKVKEKKNEKEKEEDSSHDHSLQSDEESSSSSHHDSQTDQNNSEPHSNPQSPTHTHTTSSNSNSNSNSSSSSSDNDDPKSEEHNNNNTKRKVELHMLLDDTDEDQDNDEDDDEEDYEDTPRQRRKVKHHKNKNNKSNTHRKSK